MTRSCNDIRKEFIDFFVQRGHSFVPSSPLLPAEDPTLLFTNAGMNQFKDIFLGLVKRDYVRAANTQKCIRAGGKHNDLEDVGHDTYHHTFFEMLGNWSFGDYFKAEAIAWAWELLTKVWGLDKGRLYVTVFQGDEHEGLAADDGAAGLWQNGTDIEAAHILRGNKKDNFWEMGETGPCGPCSEIHIDMTPDKSGRPLVNAGDARVIEIWNLVFMQYNRGSDGKLTPLTATHVDTGMGFERICMVLQGKRSNYATDLFVPIIEKIETLTSHRYGQGGARPSAANAQCSPARRDSCSTGKAGAAGGADPSSCLGASRFDVADMDNITDVAFRVIADHARTLTFAIADGVLPSNEGRGYVLRRILRRACRYGRQYLNIEGTFLVELVDTVVELMGDAFGELRTRQDYIAETIREEEVSFGRTLDRGIDLFAKQAEKIKAESEKVLGGEVAFDLYATYGFPVDLTQIMAAEAGLEVDMAGYEKAMAEHRELSGAGKAFQAAEVLDLPASDDSAKYAAAPIEAKVLGWVLGGAFISRGKLQAGQGAALVLDRTNFYAEQGGQVGDSGTIKWPGGSFAVTDTQLAGAGIVHVGSVEAGTLAVGDAVTLTLDPRRMDIMRNHTGTHLLNWALREVLGEHVNQAGSVVAPDKLRFDFSHNQAVTHDQLARVERMVNDRILADEPVTHRVMPLAEAKKVPGVRAVFGEKYPDPVRVITIGGAADSSAEFCGGTHLKHTGQIGSLKIISEESVAKGVRRITALTGRGAIEHMLRADEVLRLAAQLLRVKPEEVPERIEALAKEVKELRKAPKAPAGAAAVKEFAPEVTISTPVGAVIVGRMDLPDANAMRAECDRQRQKGAAGLFVGASGDGKVMLVAMVSDELVATGKISADKWIKAVAAIVGGGGGGRATLAQAGGKNPEKLAEALAAAGKWAAEALG
jgi:alanyl-tRNA synthetase